VGKAWRNKTAHNMVARKQRERICAVFLLFPSFILSRPLVYKVVIPTFRRGSPPHHIT
jgi:hypothetical protein